MQKIYDLENINHISERCYSNEQKEKLADVEWLNKKHTIDKVPLYKIAEIIDVSSTTVAKYFKKHKIPIKYFNSSFIESEIKDFLKQNKVQYIGNDRKLIAPYEIDIFIPKYKLAIEMCGIYWHNELHKDTNYHKDKYEMCRNKRIQLITIFEDEWVKTRDIVKESILNKLGINNERIFARKTNVIELEKNNKTKRFFDKTHIQGNAKSSFIVGLTYNSTVVAQASFLRLNDNTIQLNRYSSSVRVVGGLSKIISYLKKKTNYRAVETFSDLRWSDGNLYDVLGFERVKNIPPDYSYVLGDRRYHKFGFRHKQLKNKLKIYDSALTEHQNCFNNKIYRIYDCGKIKHEFDLTL